MENTKLKYFLPCLSDESEYKTLGVMVEDDSDITHCCVKEHSSGGAALCDFDIHFFNGGEEVDGPEDWEEVYQ